MKIFWKIYAIINVVIVVLFVIGGISTSGATLADKALAFVYIPSALAIIGLAYRKAYGPQTLWYAYTILFFGYNICYFLFLTNSNSNEKVNITDLLLGLLILAPPYVANILYSVKFSKFISVKSVLPIPQSAVVTNIAASSAPSQTWNMSEPVRHDSQLNEIQQQQSLATATSAMGQSLAKSVQETHDAKIEAEQLGKWPWSRWYSHPVMGRDSRKGIADIIFLSIFGSSSATDVRHTRGERAFFRIIITLAVVAVAAVIRQLLFAR